ncbi:MAG: 1-deoxy-D-xylulose-5-phosphate reductoisomerase [Hyphomonadaceae bacterium]|nr:1-deoxy-D-xylulose-5-phosphate reductoisomerase [Hyphomonadaceae bacterium]MBC6412902.1 1-deoxy-D-xylulose-5-phosphate reductoisomerase [Hyphomonadaceae bacterium]
MTKKITILGSTGSIGQSTLDLVRRAGADAFEVIALTANSNVDDLVTQTHEFRPRFIALADVTRGDALRARLSGVDVQIGIGPEAVVEAARIRSDFTMAAIVGAAGLPPTLAAVEQGIHIGLANKECLVCAGELFMHSVRRHGAMLLPVDSEHNAIFQVLERNKPKAVKRFILTASGGPFWQKSLADLRSVSCTDALNHPVWSMGARISVDSATLMNKGFELIEAHYLFDRASEEIDIIVHPQSIVHSMVEYIDGSVLAQMGTPDMRIPIAYALCWPERMEAPVQQLNLAEVSQLTFFEPDLARFPALKHARTAMETGGFAPNILNAADEVAVTAFIGESIKFLQIEEVISRTLEICMSQFPADHDPMVLADVIAVDEQARQTAGKVIASL